MAARDPPRGERSRGDAPRPWPQMGEALELLRQRAHRIPYGEAQIRWSAGGRVTVKLSESFEYPGPDR